MINKSPLVPGDQPTRGSEWAVSTGHWGHLCEEALHVQGESPAAVLLGLGQAETGVHSHGAPAPAPPLPFSAQYHAVGRSAAEVGSEQATWL